MLALLSNQTKVMSKQFVKKRANSIKSRESFLGFWHLVATCLGDGRLRILKNAEALEQLLAPNSDHRDFLRDIIITSYFECDCCSLDDSVDVNTILDVLGEAAYELQARNADDLLDIELLEEIAYHIQQHFPHKIKLPESVLPSKHDKASAKKRHAAVYSLNDRRIRQANAKL